MGLRPYDTLVVGGGVVGLSIGYGLARAGERVCLLDEGDNALRAARGNFGLVWVQGKGVKNADYARWTMAAAERWPSFAEELKSLTGIDVELSQIGGLNICLDHRELSERATVLASLSQSLGGDYPYEVLDIASLRRMSPHVSPDVAGAIFCPMDGHVNPMRLLKALAAAFVKRDGTLLSGSPVERVECDAGAFHIRTKDGDHVADRLVLAAGLGNRRLAPMVGLKAPVAPVRGQLLISERVQPFLRYPSLQVRQTGDGTVQIGDSKEDVGFDDGTTIEQVSRIAQRAVRCFPVLRNVNVVRTWGALRVMSPNGLPIYEASRDCPGAFVATCHSGITLAALHAGALVDWLRGGNEPVDIRGFKAERFNV